MTITIINDEVAVTADNTSTRPYIPVSHSLGRIAAAQAEANRHQCPECGRRALQLITTPILTSKEFKEKYSTKNNTLRCRVVACSYCDVILIRVVSLRIGEQVRYFSNSTNWGAL
jgi:predicted RNA-binding Zn-ribbon protein involved in translation (DUF1610 family)